MREQLIVLSDGRQRRATGGQRLTALAGPVAGLEQTPFGQTRAQSRRAVTTDGACSTALPVDPKVGWLRSWAAYGPRPPRRRDGRPDSDSDRDRDRDSQAGDDTAVREVPVQQQHLDKHDLCGHLQMIPQYV